MRSGDRTSDFPGKGRKNKDSEMEGWRDGEMERWREAKTA